MPTNENITFDAMPGMMASILERLGVIEAKVNHLTLPPVLEKKDVWLNLKGLCDYLPSHPAEQTVYGWTSTHFIPFHKKGKNIAFLKSEIDEWLCQGKSKSHFDLQQEAKDFVNRKNNNRSKL